MGSKPSKFLHKAKIFETGRDISVGFGLVLGMKFEDVLFFFSLYLLLLVAVFGC